MDENLIEEGNLYDPELYSIFKEEIERIDLDIDDINKFNLEKDNKDEEISKQEVKEIIDHKNSIKKRIKDLIENDLIESVPKEDITPIKKPNGIENFDDINKVMFEKKDYFNN